MIKTFRGLIANGAQDTIVLHTNDGEMGYKIVKFEIIGPEPGQDHMENIVKIYKVSQLTIDNAVDFSDNTLLGVAYLTDNAGEQYPLASTVIFDQEIFNQDIYVTHIDVGAYARACNYYIELEQIKLDVNASTVATLKDIRNEVRIAPA